jgi:hypothetical protein
MLQVVRAPHDAAAYYLRVEQYSRNFQDRQPGAH